MARQHRKPKPQATTADGARIVSRNKRLRHDYEVLDSCEAGLVLRGSEVKSLRAGDVQWQGAHARIERGEAWVYDLHIGEYRQAAAFGHAPTRPRKLLLHRQEIDRLDGRLRTRGLTLVPERILFRRGVAKLTLCLVRGKQRKDKRRDLENRARQRDVERELARRRK